MSLLDRLSRLERLGGWRSAAFRAYLGVHHAAARAGVHVVRASYDSPIPRRGDLPADVFTRLSPMRAIAWDPEAQLRFVETELAPLIAQAPEGTLRRGNRTYDHVDADLLYGIVRWSRPKLVLELGSGYSSLVAAQALHDNGRGEIELHDPYPSPHVLEHPELRDRVHTTSAQNVPEERIAALQAGDVLFVDTTHTVKLGGDVNRIVFDLLPLVAPGVLVHFHDIFLPSDYLPDHLQGAHYWTEQYLLQAFLMYNDAWEVVVGGRAVALHDPARLAAAIPAFGPGVVPGAFWIRRRPS